MKKIMFLVVAVLAIPTLTGCQLMSKGTRINASLGLEGYDDHEEKIVVRPDDKPIICKLWPIEGVCTQANQAQGS